MRLICLLLACFAVVASAEPRRLRVLFLGHKDGMHPGHKTQLRYMDLLQATGSRGLDMDYADDLSVLNPRTLGRYDVLALYANWKEIAPDQEKAVLDFVESGHGFAPIHCASYCFLNSMKLTMLTGARFKKHGMEEFGVTDVLPEHPILKGLTPFRTFDETYVHELHNETDRTILQRRVDAAKGEDEPWTWVRTQGKGRIFYTAYGHDEKTWTQKGFQELVIHGFLWAAGEEAVARMEALHIPPLEYADGASVPNYEQRNPPPKLQKPLPPAEAKKHLSVPADMKVELFASELDGLWNVIEFKFDERGRCWTCESLDYPNERKPQGEGRDRIRILEDTNGDGKADKFTVFAEGLSIPTSLCFANDGVIVTNMPDTTFLKDTNGDGRADERRVLFTGWGTYDTHATVSSLCQGMDGWIYGCVGYSGFKGQVGGEWLEFLQGPFRFKPDGSKLEYLNATSNNTWGCALDENGDLFGSTANGESSWYCPIPRRYYSRTPGIQLGRLPGIDANKRAPHLREYIRQVDWWNGFTAAACHNFYTARSFPQRYWNRIAFIAEPTAHLLYQGIVEPRGSDFVVNNGLNLIASDDEWFAPVYASTGPDGSVYVSDFYSFLIQHNPTPSVERGGFAAMNGNGNAFVSDLRDTERARIWKISARDSQPSRQWQLSKDRPAELLEALQSDNLLWRNHAQRLLVERGNKDVVPQLKEMAAKQDVDAAGIAGGAQAALWTLEGLREMEPGLLMAAVNHSAKGVSRAAIRIASNDVCGYVQLAAKLKDDSPLVQLTALLALADFPHPTELLGPFLFDYAATSPSLSKDKWLPVALTMAAARHAEGFLTAAASAAGGADLTNLLPNPGFEDANGDTPAAWEAHTFDGTPVHAVDRKVFRTGSHSLRLSSQEGGNPKGTDASWRTEVTVEPNADYLFTAWIKTEKVSPSRSTKGAIIEVHPIGKKNEPTHSAPIIGTQEWSQVSVTFNSGTQMKLTLSLQLGGWGMARGKMWVDDVSLTKSTGNPQTQIQPGLVANAFARTATPEQKTALISKLGEFRNPVAEQLIAVIRTAPADEKIETLDDLANTHQILKLATIPGGMKYDPVELKANAGRPIAISFSNPDAMQHNLVAAKPGSLPLIAEGAAKMMTAPDGMAKAWIPNIPEIIAGTRMLDPKESAILKLPALEPGDYVLACTFPGHPMLMKGTLRVE